MTTKTQEVKVNPDTPSSSAPILDISTIAPVRPTIRIKTLEDPEGKLYEVKTFKELSVHDQQFLYSRGNLLSELMEKNNLNDEETSQLSLALDGMVMRIMVDLPEPVHAKLEDSAKLQMVEAFMLASPETAEAYKTVKAQMEKRITGSSSEGSKPSSEETQSDGSTSPS